MSADLNRLADAIERLQPVLAELLHEIKTGSAFGPRIVKTDDGHELRWPDGLSVPLAEDDQLFRYISAARNRAFNAELGGSSSAAN